MAERTLVRAQTQVRDASVTLEKLAPEVVALLTRQELRVDFVASVGQTLLSNSNFQPVTNVAVYRNGVLMNSSEYDLGAGNISLHAAAEEAEQFTVFYGDADNVALNALADKQSRFFVGSFSGEIVPAVGDSRWYPYVSIGLISVYCSVGTAPSTGAIVVDILKNGSSIFGATKPSIPVGQFKSNRVDIAVAMTPADYLTTSVLQAGGGKDLSIFVVYSV